MQKKTFKKKKKKKGFISVTLVCPSMVVEAIRSWKTDVCKRKIQLSFHSFSESLDTAEVLFSLKETFSHDFVVIMGSVLFDGQVRGGKGSVLVFVGVIFVFQISGFDACHC